MIKPIEKNGDNLVFDNEHYDIRKDISPYQINIRVGGRGCGKSIGVYRYCIDNFIQSKDMFMIIRRTVTNPSEQLGEIVRYYKDYNFYYETDEHTKIAKVYISPIEEEDGKEKEDNKMLCGYIVALSCSQKYKSNSFPVKTVVFEEFMKSDTERRVSKDECATFFDLLETIVRDREDVTAILLSNAVKINNDYFIFWGINIDTVDSGKKVQINEVVNIIKIPPDYNYIVRKSKTLTFKATKNTDFHKYAYGNDFSFDLGKYVKKQKDNSMPNSQDDKFVVYHKKIYWINKKYISHIEITQIPKKAVIIAPEKVEFTNLKIVDEFYIQEYFYSLKPLIVKNDLYFDSKQIAIELSYIIFGKEF